MKVTVHTTERTLALDTPVGDASQQWDERHSLIVTLSSPNGVRGMGEAAPLPGRSKETIEVARQSIAPCKEFELDAEMTGTAVLDMLGDTHDVAESPSVHFALESAALDWLACARGEALYKVISDIQGGTLNGSPGRVPIAALIGEWPPTTWQSLVGHRYGAGFQTIKFKVGRDWKLELSTLRSIRKSFPMLTIRLDANQTLSVADFADAQDALAALAIEFIEEPVAPSSLAEIKDTSVPIALDETMLDEPQAREALALNAVAVAVLKPTLLGGIREALRWVKLASEHDVDTIVSHSFEGEVGLRACAELALALQTRRAAGLGAHCALAPGALDAFPVFAGHCLNPRVRFGVAP